MRNKNNLTTSTALFLAIALGVFLLSQSCKHKIKRDKQGNALADTLAADTAKIVVDESFQPIVDEELYIFKASYPNLHPEVTYAPENDAIALLLNYKAEVAVLSRDLNAQEARALNERKFKPVVSRFAIDAVALIVNKASNDTTITLSEIKKMLNGDTKQDKNIVFDNPNSGLVRYLKDITGNTAFKQKKIYSLKSNKEVIKYVSEHPDAIGITGFSWLNDPDKDYADALDKVKIMSVKDDVNKGAPVGFFSPSQNTLALKQYPLSRNLYVLDCSGKISGLGRQFAAFLVSDRGQMIILKSGLLPDSIPSRQISINKKIKQ
jgi:phosphate transport system substrate-binding protein